MVSKTPKPRKKKKDEPTNKEIMLENPDIRRWYENTARGSSATADVYVRRLWAVCNRLNIKAHDFVDMDKDARYDLILDFVGGEEKRGMSGSYIASSLKAIRSWLAHKGIKIERKIKVKGAERTPTLKDERVPTQKELHKIFLSGSPRDRVCCVIMAHSGVRPEVLGNYEGNDGLRVRDFPEMRIEGEEIIFDAMPTMIRVREELSKTGKEYFSFLSTQGCEYLKEYLESRLRAGETFTIDTDVITPKSFDKSFIRSINIGDIIRKSIRGAGFSWRPYVLRAYCDTQLLLAESKGKITHAYRQFFMGHVGDMEARYTTNKGRLTEEMIEDMREAYKNSEGFLQTIIIEDEDKEDADTTFKRRLLRMGGKSDEEIVEMDLEEITDEYLMDVLQQKVVGTLTGNGGSQKVISVDEVEKYIGEGWEYVSTLPGGKAIVKFPN